MQSLFTGVDWKQTLIINSIRAALSGIVTGLLFLFFSDDKQSGYMFLFFMVPIFWVAIFPLCHAVNLLTNMGVPAVGWFNTIWAGMMSLGDPIYFLIGRILKWVPHSPDQSPFSMYVYILILRDDVPHVSQL